LIKMQYKTDYYYRELLIYSYHSWEILIGQELVVIRIERRDITGFYFFQFDSIFTKYFIKMKRRISSQEA